MTGFEFVTLYTAGNIPAVPRPNHEEVADGLSWTRRTGLLEDASGSF
jgi:hypothetical protein